MLELADWFGLTYYMMEEISPSNHIILVVDKNGKKTTFNLESACEIPLKNELDKTSVKEAIEMIKDSKHDFLEYWLEHKNSKDIK